VASMPWEPLCFSCRPMGLMPSREAPSGDCADSGACGSGEHSCTDCSCCAEAERKALERLGGVGVRASSELAVSASSLCLGVGGEGEAFDGKMLLLLLVCMAPLICVCGICVCASPYCGGALGGGMGE